MNTNDNTATVTTQKRVSYTIPVGVVVDWKLSNKAISVQLGVSVSTVRNVRLKLGMPSNKRGRPSQF